MHIEFSRENFDKLSEYIYRKTGISLSYEKHYEKLKKNLELRFRVLKIDSFRKYFFLIRFEDKNGSEFQELISTITVNETYFYRERYQFDVLVSDILPEIHSKKRDGENIRILCSPCSSGEEPYSVALYLLEDNEIINKRDIELVGIDIDNKIIEKAKEGLYTSRSLHLLSDKERESYFGKKMGNYEIIKDIRDAVDFRIVNVFDKDAMRKLGKFDVIFSRNMLIYFDDASRKEVATTFHEMLNSGGYIFLGHAEYMSRIVSIYTPVKISNVLLYQK